LELNKETAEKKIEAAKKDLDVWENLSETRGLTKEGKPSYESSFSCKLVKDPKLPEGYTKCKNKKFGKCVFYRCNLRDNYQYWLKHHHQNHRYEDLLYISCNECNNIRNIEVEFMKSAISKFKMDLEKEERIAELRKKFRNML
jgi:hypothetical protein